MNGVSAGHPRISPSLSSMKPLSSSNQAEASALGITSRITKQPCSLSAAFLVSSSLQKLENVRSGIASVFLLAMAAVIDERALHVFSQEVCSAVCPYSAIMAFLMLASCGSASAVSDVYWAQGRMDEVILVVRRS